jgi:hypothetical protein
MYAAPTDMAVANRCRGGIYPALAHLCGRYHGLKLSPLQDFFLIVDRYLGLTAPGYAYVAPPALKPV